MSTEQYKTTAAEAKLDAPHAGVAKSIDKFASQEQQAAQDASQVAREAGTKLTGNPDGDADASKVKESLTSTRITGVEAYGNQSSTPGQSVPSVLHAADAAKKKTGATYEGAKETVASTAQSATDTAKGVVGTAQDTVNSAINKTTETMASTRDAAMNTAGGAYQYTKDTASAAVGKTGETKDAAANKTGESYQATKDAAEYKKDEAVGESKGILSSITETASAALSGAGGYVQAAAGTATGAASKVVETAQGMMGMGNNKPGEDVRTGMASGQGEEQFSRDAIPPSSAKLESGKHDVKGPYNETTKVGKEVGLNAGNPPKALS